VHNGFLHDLFSAFFLNLKIWQNAQCKHRCPLLHAEYHMLRLRDTKQMDTIC